MDEEEEEKKQQWMERKINGAKSRTQQWTERKSKEKPNGEKKNPTISNGAKKNPATHAPSQRLWCQQVLIVPFVRECQSLT